MLAHELRNPLAPIRNALEILRLTDGNWEVVPSACEIIERQLSQMIRLVDDLLDVSRITRGKIELQLERIELASVVNDAVEAALPRLEGKGLNLVVTLPAQPVYLDADAVRLAQVVGNLLNNAGKFTDQGGHVWLTVEVTSDEKEESGDVDAELAATEVSGDHGSEGLKLLDSSPIARNSPLAAATHAVIRVRDTGIGIAADQLPQIFALFFQVDTSLERMQSGLGIGLMLAKNLVELHGGTLEGHSGGLGQGSEFVVRLPLAKDGCRVMSGEKVESSGEALITRPLTRTTKSRILIVDDNVDSAESLTRLLDLSGNETRTAYDGLEALEAAAAFRPDAILLDIGLPELNGYEVAPQDTGAAMGGENYVGGRDGLGAGRGPPSLARSRFQLPLNKTR
jgi:CheY-like chemotaxis protein